MQHDGVCGEARFAGRGPQSRYTLSCEGERDAAEPRPRSWK